MLVAKATRLAQVGPQLLVVVAQLGDGVLSRKRCKRQMWPIERQRAIAITPEFSSPPGHVSREAGHRLLRVVLAMNRCLHRPSPLPAVAAFAA
jgi:hypothetical protein